MRAKKLEILTHDVNAPFEVYTIPAWEFSNGVILEGQNWFASRENYQPQIGEVLLIKETSETCDWEPGDLALAVIRSLGKCVPVPNAVFQLFDNLGEY